MKPPTQPYPLSIVLGLRNRINTRPIYQRGAVWKKPQKQLLMDTILRNYDIPKLYWHNTKKDDGFQFEVVDGQQRLLAIWDFFDDVYPLAKNIDPIKGFDVSGQFYSNLPFELAQSFNLYPLDVVIITDAEEVEIRDMFRRLQNGTSLKPQEKRDSLIGDMSDAVKEIAKHPFLENCAFKNTRSTFALMAAQTILLEIEGGATNIKSPDLNKMYETYARFDDKEKTIQKVKKVYDFLLEAFPKKNPILERYNIVNLYCIASLLINDYVWKDLAKPLADWFIKFEMERRENDGKEQNERDASLSDYRHHIKSSGDTAKFIERRLDLLRERFFSEYPDIKKRDPVRSFSHEQRLAIYWRDEGRCQLCTNCTGEEKLDWDGWHADHKKSHHDGGETTVSNGQVACPACNLSKGNKSS